MPSRRITRMIVTSFQVSPPRGGGAVNPESVVDAWQAQGGELFAARWLMLSSAFAIRSRMSAKAVASAGWKIIRAFSVAPKRHLFTSGSTVSVHVIGYP